MNWIQACSCVRACSVWKPESLHLSWLVRMPFSRSFVSFHCACLVRFLGGRLCPSGAGRCLSRPSWRARTAHCEDLCFLTAPRADLADCGTVLPLYASLRIPLPGVVGTFSRACMYTCAERATRGGLCILLRMYSLVGTAVRLRRSPGMVGHEYAGRAAAFCLGLPGTPFSWFLHLDFALVCAPPTLKD